MTNIPYSNDHEHQQDAQDRALVKSRVVNNNPLASIQVPPTHPPSPKALEKTL